MRFTIFQESRKGSRSLNQDRIAYTYSRDTLLLVVADGMGGHAGGEIAAQIAVRLFIERFQQEATPILKNPLTFLHETMVKAHAALGSYSAQFSMLETPRTTCVACIVQGGHAYWVHVGDSRLYLYRRGALLDADARSFEGAVPRRPGADPRRRRVRASGPQQGLQLPRRHGRSGHRSVEPDAAARRRHPRPLHGRPVGPDPERGDRDLAHVRADPQGRSGNDARGRAARAAPTATTCPRSSCAGDRRPRSTSRRRRSPRRCRSASSRPRSTRRFRSPDRKGAERDLSEDEIERAIDEIQTSIRRYRR